MSMSAVKVSHMGAEYIFEDNTAWTLPAFDGVR